VVLLHAGVGDQREWTEVADRLAGRWRPLTYDRPGHGSSAPAPGDDLADLWAVARVAGPGPCRLVGCSAGGGIALDAALARPGEVAAMVLVAPAVSGAPEGDLDPATAALSDALDEALGRRDADEVNRLEARLWLDGPAGPEGRVGGEPRRRFLAMNAVVLAHELAAEGTDGEAPPGPGAWDRLEELATPTTVACGRRDVPILVARAEALARRLPAGEFADLGPVAHLPQLEAPAALADTVARALERTGRR
jgi:pimeloyl-ACP methyl ester carboxylesterase